MNLIFKMQYSKSMETSKKLLKPKTEYTEK